LRDARNLTGRDRRVGRREPLRGWERGGDGVNRRVRKWEREGVGVMPDLKKKLWSPTATEKEKLLQEGVDAFEGRSPSEKRKPKLINSRGS